jgi:hypothetical protein
VLAARRTRAAVVAAGLIGALLALGVGGAGLLTGSVGAQTPEPTTVPPVDPNAAPADPNAAAIDPNTGLPVDPNAPVDTTPTPSLALPSTTNIPLNCTKIPPPYLVFVGRITAYQIPTFRFEVEKVVSGKWDGPLVDVQFPQDAGFLRLGRSYLVAAQLDRTTGRLTSKVRTSFSNLPKPGTCPGEDPVITKMSNGKPVDTGLLVGMHGRWKKVVVAFLVPAAAVFGVLLLLVSLKHVLTRVLKVTPVSSRREPYTDN